MSYDRYGYYGEVSYQDQNRFRPYSIAGLGSIPAVASGGYRGQLGKLVFPQPRQAREMDRTLLRALDIQLAGPGLGVTDREMCNTLLTTSGALATAVGSAFGSEPVRRSGETQTQYEARLREWQIATRTSTTGGNVLSATSSLCNLIDQAAQPAPTSPSSTSDWQLMAAREELRRMYEQQAARPSLGISPTVLLAGGAVAAAAAVYFLFFRD